MAFLWFWQEIMFLFSKNTKKIPDPVAGIVAHCPAGEVSKWEVAFVHREQIPRAAPGTLLWAEPDQILLFPYKRFWLLLNNNIPLIRALNQEVGNLNFCSTGFLHWPAHGTKLLHPSVVHTAYG